MIVICFDIVNSSRIDPNWSKEFVSRLLGECQDLMVKDFDAQSLRSNAFRIKELGDGFLCSIGFPFKSSSDLPLAQTAIELAHEFVDVFEKLASEYPHGHNLLCSIGIAEGDIEGFFTVSGAKHYELHGKAIVLATRYEALRKSMPCKEVSI